MPAAIGAAFYSVLGAVGVYGSTAIAVGYVVQAVLVNVALGALSRSLSPKVKSGSSGSFSTNVTARGTTEYRRMVFGKRRVGGVLDDYGASSSGGSTNDRLSYVVIFAGHQVNAIRDIWIDNVKISESDINTTTDPGLVEAGQYAGVLRITKHLGTSGQAADSAILARFSDWDSTYRLAGCAYILVSCAKDDTKWTAGPPQNISALVEGALCYDPRLDSTNGGSGSHRYTDPSTWAYTENPALHVRHLLSGGSAVNDVSSPLIMYGLGDSNTLIDDAYTISAANHCDEVLSGANAPPSGSQVRYKAHLEATADQTHRQILNDLLAAMAGTAIIVKDKWRIAAGVYVTPIHTLNQDNVYGDLKIQDTDPHGSRYNAVSAKFIDASQQYVETTTPYRTSSTYEAQDGGERIPLDITLSAVTDQYQAQRLAEIKKRQSRMQRRVVIPGALDILKCALNESILFSHTRYGWSSRVLKVTDRQFEFNQDAGRVIVTTVRDDSAVWTDMLTADYATGTSFTDTFQIDGPTAPLSLVATSVPMGLVLSWTVGTDNDGIISELWEHTASSPFSSATKIYEGMSNAFVAPKGDTDTRYYWVRRRNSASGALSGTFPTGTGVAGAAGTTDTDMITPGATIETFQGASTGNTSPTSFASTAPEWKGGPGGISLGDNVPPDVDCGVTVTISISAYISSYVSGDVLLGILFRDDNPYPSGSSVAGAQLSPLMLKLSTTPANYSLRWTFTHTAANAAIGCATGLFAESTDASNQITVTDGAYQVEFFKR